MQLFRLRFADFPRMLASLPEFHLFRIIPVSGAYVRGTAMAYMIDGERLLHPDDVCGCANTEARRTDAPASGKRGLQ